MLAATIPDAARRVSGEWNRLAAKTLDTGGFDPAAISDLPVAAQRWLTHSIAPGTPLAQSVSIVMNGEIKIGGWHRFTATQVIAEPTGYIWAARTRILGLPLVGYDRYSVGTGEMRWRLLGVIPVVSAAGPDVTRSAAGRLASEIVMLPTAFRRASWTELGDDRTATATIPIDGHHHDVTLQIHSEGALQSAVIQRWGNPNGLPFGRYPFGLTVEREATFGGVTIPSTLRAGWFWGTSRQREGEFFRATITAADFR